MRSRKFLVNPRCHHSTPLFKGSHLSPLSIFYDKNLPKNHQFFSKNWLILLKNFHTKSLLPYPKISKKRLSLLHSCRTLNFRTFGTGVCFLTKTHTLPKFDFFTWFFTSDFLGFLRALERVEKNCYESYKCFFLSNQPEKPESQP